MAGRGGVCESENRQSALALYRDVVNDVIENIKTAFLEEGLDESLVRELQQVTSWTHFGPDIALPLRPFHRISTGKCRFCSVGKPTSSALAPSEFRTTLSFRRSQRHLVRTTCIC